MFFVRAAGVHRFIRRYHFNFIKYFLPGPVSRDVGILEKMMETGMNVARMNFSHGSHEYHAETIRNCREAEKNYSAKLGIPFSLAIALDTKGPEIRTGLLEGVSLEDKIVFSPNYFVIPQALGLGIYILCSHRMYRYTQPPQPLGSCTASCGLITLNFFDDANSSDLTKIQIFCTSFSISESLYQYNRHTSFLLN